jgi:hypothetical protein
MSYENPSKTNVYYNLPCLIAALADLPVVLVHGPYQCGYPQIHILPVKTATLSNIEVAFFICIRT